MSNHGPQFLSPPSSGQQNQAASQALTGTVETPTAAGVSGGEVSSSGTIPTVPSSSGPHTKPHTPHSGDRTRGPDVDTQLRGLALALRDLTETTGLTDLQATFPDGTSLTYSVDDGCHLLTTQGGTIDLTEWMDQPGLLPADGVEGVADQFVTRAAVAGRHA